MTHFSSLSRSMGMYLIIQKIICLSKIFLTETEGNLTLNSNIRFNNDGCLSRRTSKVFFS